MATHTSQDFCGRLTNIQRNSCISDLYIWVHAFETTVEDISKAPTNPNDESFRASVPQPERLQLDTNSCESIKEFL